MKGPAPKRAFVIATIATPSTAAVPIDVAPLLSPPPRAPNYRTSNPAFPSTDQVFETTLQPMISDVMRGFEATVFAYGQTGTGKTYTMEGDVESEENQGVIPRALRDIFDR